MAKKLSFEAAFQRLEEIARLLESNDVPLQTSVALYEEGMKLVNACSEELNGAEKKLLTLSKTVNGFETTPLSGDLED